MLQTVQGVTVLKAVKEQLHCRASSQNLNINSWTQEQWWESFNFLVRIKFFYSLVDGSD
jgi:hypothetical protein